MSPNVFCCGLVSRTRCKKKEIRKMSKQSEVIENLMLLYVRIDQYEHDMHGSRSRRVFWSFLTEEQAASQGVVSPGRRGGGLGFLIMARKLAALSPNKPPPTAPSGMVPGYQKAATRTRGKKARRQARAQRPSSCANRHGSNRETRTSSAVLSRLPRQGETLRGFSQTLHRGYPRRDHAPSSQNISSVATGARSARSWSNRRFPTPCRGLP